MGRHTVRVWVAESLRFFLPARHRHGEVMVVVDGASSLGHLVESLGVPRTEFGELRVNSRSAAARTRPYEGDVVDVLPARRPQQIAEPRFLLDVHLGSLARRMRLLGLDTAYTNNATDDELVAQAAEERRVLLTQDRGLLRRRSLAAAGYVRGVRGDEQLLDVLDRFGPPLSPWSRCPICNGELEPIEKQTVQHLLKPGTRRSYKQFSQCQACGRPYWRGAHARRLDAIVARAIRLTGEGSGE
jgi:uncharacterized protein with PIN domain